MEVVAVMHSTIQVQMAFANALRYILEDSCDFIVPVSFWLNLLEMKILLKVKIIF